MVRELLEHKRATSFEPDSFGTSAIHEAAQAGYDDIVHILIEAGADRTSMDRNGRSPFYYAARNGCDKVISVSGSVDNYYELVLAFREAIEAGEAHVVTRLLKFMARDTVRERSTTLLSIRARHLNVLDVLLVHGADISCAVPSPSDRIPLHQAIKHGRADMAKLLLDHGANIQKLDDKKRNALFETLKAPNTEGLSLLLDGGIRVDRRDSEGNTVLHQAAVDGRVEHARSFIQPGSLPKISWNDEGLTPLHLAVRAQQFEIAEMLLECRGVDVNIEATRQAAGWTLLMYAVAARSLRLCDLLIRKGAHVSDKEGTDLLTTFKLAQEGDDQGLGELPVLTWNRPRPVSMCKFEA